MNSGIENKTGFKDKMENFFSSLVPRLLNINAISIFFIVVSIFLLQNYKSFAAWEWSTNPFDSDSDQYYSYLPQTIIHDDLGFTKTERYWTVKLDNGNRIQRFTCGVALLEAPWFLLGHWIAKNYGYTADGYSPPYVYCVFIGIVLYVFIGLAFLYKSLRLFFGPRLSTLVVAIIFLATNLYFYTVSNCAMSHSFLFFLQAVFFYNVLMWHRTGKLINLIAFSFFGGFATLVRPTDILILILPMLMGIYNIATAKEKLKFFLSKKFHLLIGAAFFLLAVLPQLLYWKHYTGHFYFYSYKEEGFFFSDPKIIKFLFGYRKGLIPYAPVMIFSFIGFIFLWIKNRPLFWPILIFHIVNVYVLSSWWDYGFGGGLGNRAMVQSFVTLAFPMAAFFHWFIHLSSKRIFKILFTVISIGIASYCVDLNFIMTRQFKSTILHWGGMNKETYWFIWRREKDLTQEDFAKRERLIKEPNTDLMKKGFRDQ